MIEIPACIPFILLSQKISIIPSASFYKRAFNWYRRWGEEVIDMEKWNYWIVILIVIVLSVLPAASAENGKMEFPGVYGLNPVGTIADLSHITSDGQLKDSGLAISLISPVSDQSNMTNIQNTAASDVKTPITIKLTQSKIPLVNEETILHVEVNSIFNAPDTNVKLMLPPSVELIHGSLERSVNLQANIPESFDTIIKFTEPGNFKITALARKTIDPENSWGDMDVLYLTVGNVSSTISTYGSIGYAEPAQSASGSKTTPLLYAPIGAIVLMAGIVLWNRRRHL